MLVLAYTGDPVLRLYQTYLQVLGVEIDGAGAGGRQRALRGAGQAPARVILVGVDGELGRLLGGGVVVGVGGGRETALAEEDVAEAAGGRLLGRVVDVVVDRTPA